MKKSILILNLLIIILALLVFMELIPYEAALVFIFAAALVDAVILNSKRELLIYYLILLSGFTIGLLADYFERKSYGVGFHPEYAYDLRIEIFINIVCAIIICGAGYALNYLLKRRKQK